MLMARWTRPEVLLPITFLLAILAGAGLLLLPGMSTGAQPVGPLEALFTSTSAVCVTGLIVVDTGTAWTHAGQAVIAALIQVGGLGIMTFSVLALVLVGKRVGLSHQNAIKKTWTPLRHWHVGRLLGAVISVTVLIETAGFLVLRRALHDDWSAVFHTISAFCNAGFSLYADSLDSHGPVAALTCMGLFVFGGLGFTTLLELVRAVLPRREKRRRFTLHARLVFVTSAALLVIGAAVFLFEGHTVLDSFFMSASARTAGFDTTPVGRMSGASLLTLLPLMFIGASPGSTGGGIKTTTFALTFLHARATLKGRAQITVHGREIPFALVRRMFAVVACSVFVVFVAIWLLHVFEGERQEQILGLAFEAVSAFGTVGLSTGITPHLTVASKLLLCVVMFIGRVGTVSFFVLIVREASPSKLRYPEERILVG